MVKTSRACVSGDKNQPLALPDDLLRVVGNSLRWGLRLSKKPATAGMTVYQNKTEMDCMLPAV